jgi:hypothetical protein
MESIQFARSVIILQHVNCGEVNGEAKNSAAVGLRRDWRA